MGKRASQKKDGSEKNDVSERVMVLLGIMGIVGLIFLAFGVYALFEISKILGITFFVLGIATYVAFVLIEKKLKLL